MQDALKHLNVLLGTQLIIGVATDSKHWYLMANDSQYVVRNTDWRTYILENKFRSSTGTYSLPCFCVEEKQPDERFCYVCNRPSAVGQVDGDFSWICSLCKDPFDSESDKFTQMARFNRLKRKCTACNSNAHMTCIACEVKEQMEGSMNNTAFDTSKSLTYAHKKYFAGQKHYNCRRCENTLAYVEYGSFAERVDMCNMASRLFNE